MQRMGSPIDALPEELKTHIISYLDTEPPSSTWYARTPRLSLGRTEARPLKNLSTVSKGWRRLTKCLLFRCIRVEIATSLPSRADNNPFTPTSSSPSANKFRHANNIRKAEFKKWLFQGLEYPMDTLRGYRHAWQDTAPGRAAIWLNALDSTLSALLWFLTKNNLVDDVETLCVLGEGELDDNSRDYILEEAHCLIASATFWDILFRTLNPLQVTLLAPPSTLACLLNCSIRMLDAWAFSGMNCQLVTLKRQRHNQGNVNQNQPGHGRAEAVHLRSPNDYARPALASLLYIRPWTHILINEGSYLQAYSTYEYFHKEPPGIVYPLAQGFEVPMSLESITYHSVFPFHDYLTAAVNLMSTGIIRELHVKLAPSLDDNMWDSPSELGKADPSDCWGEIEQVYSLLFAGTAVAVEDGHLAVHSNVTTFSSGDYRIDSIREFLQRSFCALDWEQSVQGLWTITEAAAAKRRVIQGLDEIED